MEDKYQSLLDKYGYSFDDFHGEKDYGWVEKKQSYDYEDVIKRILEEGKNNISIRDVLKKFTPEELIESIGIEKVETILRTHKLKKIQKKLKKK